MARTKNAARKTHRMRPMPAPMQSSDMPDDRLKSEKTDGNVATTSKISLGGFTSKADRKRKRRSSDSDDNNPLSLRHFSSPMASRIKTEEPVSDSEDVLGSIPEFGRETKPSSKKIKVESMGDDAGIEPIVALENALNTDVSMQQAIEMVKTHKVLQVGNGARSWFGSYPESEDEEQPSPAIAQSPQLDRATMTPLNTWFSEADAGIQPPHKTKKQLRAERQQAEEAEAKIRKQQKAERRKASEAAAQAKKQQKAADRKKAEAAQTAVLAKKQQKEANKKQAEAAEAAVQAKKQQKEATRKKIAADDAAACAKQRKEALEKQKLEKAAEEGSKAQKWTKEELKKIPKGPAADRLQLGNTQPGKDIPKSKAQLDEEKHNMSTWTPSKVEKHVMKSICGNAMREVKLTGNVDLVLKGLKAAQEAIQSEHNRTEAAAGSEENMRQTKVDELFGKTETAAEGEKKLHQTEIVELSDYK